MSTADAAQVAENAIDAIDVKSSPLRKPDEEELLEMAVDEQWSDWKRWREVRKWKEWREWQAHRELNAQRTDGAPQTTMDAAPDVVTARPAVVVPVATQVYGETLSAPNVDQANTGVRPPGAEAKTKYVLSGQPTGWAALAKMMHEYDEDKVRSCKEDIDTLLVFVRDQCAFPFAIYAHSSRLVYSPLF